MSRAGRVRDKWICWEYLHSWFKFRTWLGLILAIAFILLFWLWSPFVARTPHLNHEPVVGSR